MNADGARHCPNCGSRIADMAAFCLGCGSRVEAQETLPAAKIGSEKSPKKVSGALVACSVLIGCLGIGMMLYITRNGSRENSIKDIHRIDFANLAYPSECWKSYPNAGFEKTLHVSNGEWTKGTGSDQIYFGIINKKIDYGDLDGDGQDEAIVHTACGFTTGNAWDDEVFVFRMGSHGPMLLSRLSSSDWLDSSLGIPWKISNVEVNGRVLGVSYLAGGSHAQPEWIATALFEWRGNQPFRTGVEKKPFSASPSSPSDGLPAVQSAQDGGLVLQLSEWQKTAVSSFLSEHPGVQALTSVSKTSGGRADVAWEDIDKYMKSGDMQFPYAAWRDFAGTGHNDLALVFVSQGAVNSWGWRKWQIVIFRQNEPHATVVTAFDSGCLDGLLYNNKTNTVEFYCSGVASGDFHWNGQSYDVKPMLGD
jgi:hypothetical protein